MYDAYFVADLAYQEVKPWSDIDAHIVLPFIFFALVFSNGEVRAAKKAEQSQAGQEPEESDEEAEEEDTSDVPLG